MAAMNNRKAAIVGCGFVGSASAFALMESGLFSELVLIDANRDRAEGEALDISHGLPFAKPMKIYAGDYADIGDAEVVIVTAQKGVDAGLVSPLIMPFTIGLILVSTFTTPVFLKLLYKNEPPEDDALPARS